MPKTPLELMVMAEQALSRKQAKKCLKKFKKLQKKSQKQAESEK